GQAERAVSPLVVMKTAPPIVSDMTCFRPMIRFIHCHVYWDNSTCPKRIYANLPTIQDLYTSRVRKRAGKITADPSHPGHKLFKLLPSGRRSLSAGQITVRQNLQTQKQFLPPRRLTTEQLTHCSIYIYPCTSCTLHF